jgi:hypothetical protein
MFTLPIQNVLDESSKERLTIWKKALEAVEKKFTLFSQENIEFNVRETPGYTYKFQLQSEPLPISLLGVWAYAVEEMRLHIDVYIPKNNDEQSMSLGTSFRYQHRGGGSNGCGLIDFGESRTKFIYLADEEIFKPSVGYYKLNEVMKNILYIKETYISEPIPADLITPFEVMENTLKGEEELSNEMRHSIGASLFLLSEALKPYLPNKDTRNSFDYRETWRTLEDAKMLSSELFFELNFA